MQCAVVEWGKLLTFGSAIRMRDFLGAGWLPTRGTKITAPLKCILAWVATRGAVPPTARWHGVANSDLDPLEARRGARKRLRPSKFDCLLLTPDCQTTCGTLLAQP